MENNVKLKKLINTEFFEQKSMFLKQKLVSSKFNFHVIKHEIKSPAVYICNKTTSHDKALVSSAVRGNYVFLKDSIIQDLYKNKLTKETKNELFKALKLLRENKISIFIFPEKNITLFGACDNLPLSITEFLYETGYDLKFFYLIGTYIVSPIWSKVKRASETKFIIHNHKLDNATLSNHSEIERNSEINHLMPSSASAYITKFETRLKSNKLAENIETLVYSCPHCKSFFSLYSEFNCLKCRECGAFLEFSNDGKILFSNIISNFDDFEKFLYQTLKYKEFDNNPIVEYKNLILFNYKTNNKTKNITGTHLKIFADKLIIENTNFNKTITISEIEDVSLLNNNTINIDLKDQTISLTGKNKENFYILIDLFKLYHEK